ncbi:hypothetical protein [Streptomyces sp. NPDC054783]
MPYLIPSRTPLTPEQVERGFDYLLALQMGGGAAVAGQAEADPELAFILLRLAEDIVWPVTAVGGDTDPCADSFVLDEVGCVLLSALRDWARDSPPRRRQASLAASSGSRETSSQTPPTRTPPTPCRRCAMSAWCWRTRWPPHPVRTSSRTSVGVEAHRCGGAHPSGVRRVHPVPNGCARWGGAGR